MVSSLLSALVVGTLVTVRWGMSSEYYGCTGSLKKIEEIPELNHAITVLRDVRCKDGSNYDYIIGIRTSQLQAATPAEIDTYNRSGH